MVFFQETICPTKKETCGNVQSFFSGHYESYGLNCQAVCDSNLKFLFFGVVAPGKTNDNVAFPRCIELFKVMENLPLGLYFLGDAAYTLSETLLIPFTGNQRENANNDAYNFYLSQLRIRIEMSFGRLVNKWQILKRKMNYRLTTTSDILLVCAKLHNFVIDEQLAEKDNPVIGATDEEDFSNIEDARYTITTKVGAPLEMEYLPILPDEEFVPIPGMSMTRTSIVENVRRGQHRRPTHNIERNSLGNTNSSQNVFVPLNQNGKPMDIEYFNPK